MTALALMRLLDRAVSEVSSEALWLRPSQPSGRLLSERSAAGMRSVRRADMAMIFRGPMTSLKPGIYYRKADCRVYSVCTGAGA